MQYRYMHVARSSLLCKIRSERKQASSEFRRVCWVYTRRGPKLTIAPLIVMCGACVIVLKSNRPDVDNAYAFNFPKLVHQNCRVILF